MHCEVTRDVLEGLVDGAVAAHPNEACGILLGEGRRITAIQPASNVHRTPATHFEIDPQALVEAHRTARLGGPQVVGYYHSHPQGPPEPSATDRAMATGDGKVWAIVGEGQIALWRDGEDGFAALSYVMVDS